MKYLVNDNCIGCGLCTATCPLVFQMGDDAQAHVTMEDVPDELHELADEAMDGCPVGAIETEE